MATSNEKSRAGRNVLARAKHSSRPDKLYRIGDIDLALHLASGVFKGCIYTEGDFYCYTEANLWEAIPKHEVDQAIAALNGVEYTFKDGDTTKTERLSLSDGRVNSIMNRLANARPLSGHDCFAETPAGINCADGFITFATSGEPAIGPHAPLHYQRHIHPARWSADADNKTLAQVVRDKFAVCFKGDDDAEQKLDLIFEVAAVAMLGMGGRKDSKALACLGETAENGKSTLLDVINAGMPPGSVSHVAAKDFKDKNEIAQLRGKRLNMSAEVGAAIGDEEFKKIITGDPVSAKNLYKDTFSFRPRAQHIFAANRMPTFPGGIGHEIRRRLLILTFNRTITEEERKQGAAVERLAETHPTEWLAAIVEGASRYLRQGGFTVPASSDEAMREWSQTADPVLAWLGDRVKKTLGDLKLHDVNEKTKSTAAHRDFKLYCRAEWSMLEKDIPGLRSFISRLKAALRANPDYQHIRHSHSGDFRGFDRMGLEKLTADMADLSQGWRAA